MNAAERVIGPLAPILLALAVAMAWSNALHGPFIFDDEGSIQDNASIHRFSTALHPPGGGETVSGRPLLNLSFALNYAVGGLNVRGYHVLNVFIHILAALTLFGLLRRTLRRPAFGDEFLDDSATTAFCIALLWALHPLQTESVTYVAQRAESLVALFYLLTLYCLVRGLESRPRLWLTLGVLACLTGAAVKEVIATAPFVALLYDRTFGAGSLRGALKARWVFYAGLFTACLAVAAVALSTSGRGGTAGFGVAIPPLEYAKAECWAVLRYLKLALWPQPLIFDYGRLVNITAAHWLPGAMVIFALGALTLVSLRRWPAAGFCAAAFFIVLAPTSSFVPLDDQVFEHRMYLPLAAVLTLIVAGLHRWARLRGFQGGVPGICLAWSLALGTATHARNEDYRSAYALWSDVALKAPWNSRAFGNLGVLEMKFKRYDKAIEYFDASLKLNVVFPAACFNKARCLALLGRPQESLPLFEQAEKIDPNNQECQYYFGLTLLKLKDYAKSAVHLERAALLDPRDAETQFNLGEAFAKLGMMQEARGHYQSALDLKPDHAMARQKLNALPGR